jgi:GGDEF domain-containing protein
MILAGPIVVNVGMSIGTAVLEPGEDPAAVLAVADQNMYLVKSRQSTRGASVSDADTTGTDTTGTETADR